MSFADNPVLRFISGQTAAYVIYGIVMAGVFEECGRFIVMKYIMLKDLFPTLYQRSVVPLWAVEVWAALVTVVVVMIAMKLYRSILQRNDGVLSSIFSTIKV